MGNNALPRIKNLKDLETVLNSAIDRVKAGEQAEKILNDPEMRRLARTIADLSKDATVRPIEQPRTYRSRQTYAGVGNRGGRGHGPLPRRPTIRDLTG